MADVLIRGLSDAAVAHIDASAAAKGLSRQEYLRRRFETERSEGHPDGKLTIEDMRRASAAAADLDNPEVMEPAWRGPHGSSANRLTPALVARRTPDSGSTG